MFCSSINTLAAFSKLSISGKIPFIEAANLVNNIQSASFAYLRSSTKISDTTGFGTWSFSTSNIPGNDSVTGSSNSQLWTDTTPLVYETNRPIPVAHYTFDIHKTNGNTCFDEINNSQGIITANAVITNANTYPFSSTANPIYPGYGQGYLLTNRTANSFASLTPVYTGSDGLSIGFWFSLYQNVGNGYMFQFVDVSNGAFASANHNIIIRVTSSTTTTYEVIYSLPNNPTSNTVYTATLPTSITDGIWRYFTLTFDKTHGNSYLYQNGTLIGSLENTTLKYPRQMMRKYLTIGNSIGDFQILNAAFSDFRIYNTTLSQLDVTELYYSYAVINNSILSFPMKTVSTAIYDETGLNTLTLNNGATVGTSAVNTTINCISLVSASSQFINLPAFQSGAEGVTISMYFRSVDNSFGAVLLDLSGSIIVQVGTSGNVLLTVSGTQIQTIITINNSVWNHLAITFTYNGNGSGQGLWRMYLNGALRITHSDATAGPNYTYFPTPQYRTNNCIGKSASSNTNYFNGEIGDVRIYNRTLSTVDVIYLFYVISKDTRQYHIPRENTLRYTLDAHDTFGTTSTEAFNTARTITLPNSNMLVNDTNPIGTTGYLTFANQSAVINTDISCGQTVAYSIYVKKPLSSTHDIIYSIGNTTVPIGQYVTMGTLNNILYYTFNTSTSGTTFAAGPPGWQGTGTLIQTNLSAYTSGDLTLTPDEKILVFTGGNNATVPRGVFMSKYTGSIYNTFSENLFQTPVQIGDISFINLQNVAMSCSAEIIVVTQRGGYVYVSTGNGTTYSTFTQTADTTLRTYTGLGMTATGSRIACSTNEASSFGGIFIANWNSSANNYDTFTQVISNASGYNTMCMSIDGSVLAYAAGTNFRWAIWNGTTYIEQTRTFTSATAPLNMKFSLDRNVIHMTTNSTTGLQFSNISADGSYNNFTGKPDANFPQNQNVTGLHITPNTNCYICINDTLNTIRRNVIYYGTTYRQHSFYQVPDANWHNYVLQVLTGSYRVITDGVQRTVRLYNFNSGMDQSFAARAAVFQNRLGTSLCTPLSTFTGQLSDFRISSNTLTNMEYVDLSNGAFYREYNNTQFNTYDFSLCYTFSPKIVVGTTVYDTAANVAATIVGTASAVYTRDTGGFLSLTNGYLSLPSISVGNAGTSIALWHFATNNGTVFEFADALSNTYLINCRVDASNSLYFTVKNNTVRYETQILHNYERNRFTHLVWNMFTNGTWQIIFNGELIRTVAGVYPYQTSYALAYVGKNTDGSTGNLNGGVDDIRIYNKTLSLDYVQQQLSIKFKKYSQYFTDVSMSSGFTTQFLLGNTIANTGTSGIVGTLTGDNLPYVWYTLERDTINIGTGTSALNGTAFGTTLFDTNTRIYGAGSIVSTTSSGINMPILALNGANGLTIACWIYRTDAGNNTYLSFNNAEMTFTSSDNTFTFTYGANSVSTQITSTYTWNHIAITLTATSPVAKIYINGVLAKSQSGFTYPSTTFTTNSILSFNGNADDFRIYQRTLADYDIYNICKSAYTTNTLQRFSVPSTYLSSVLQQDISLSTFTTPASGFSVSYWLKHEPSVAHETVFSTTRTVSGDYLTLGVLNNKLFTTVANATVPVPTFANVDISGLVYDAPITLNTTLTAADLIVTKTGNRMIFTNNWLTTGSPYINFTSSLNLQNFGNTISDYRWAPVKRIDGVFRMMHMAATADGGRLIVSQSTGGTPETGFLFLTTWNEGIGSYDPSLIKITNTPIDYQNIDMTADGNMMVFCDGTNIYLNYWNPLTNNYVQASVINQTTSGLSAFNVALTMDGSKIAYSDSTGRAVVYALWSNTLNNFDYANRVSMGTAGTESSIRNLRFSHDGRIIYASKLSDSTSSVYYGRIGGASMASIGANIRPVSQDTFGLCIDAFGYIYTVQTGTMSIKRAVATYASNYRHLYGYAAIPNNNWNHYTHTFATDGTLSVFINGQVVHRLTAVYPISVSRTNNFIGNDFFLSRSYFNGLISDFRIYNSVLTEANIAPIYYGTLQANGAKMLTYSGKTMDTNEINYVLTRTEIAVKPAPTTATYAVWTATAAKSIKITTTFANYDASTNGIGIQLFKINADTTFNTVLYSRTTTNAVLSNQNPTGYLSIPVIETDVVIGDKIYCRIDANGNSVASSAVLNIVISAK